MPFGSVTNDSEMTPYRVTRVGLDVPEPCVTELPMRVRRDAADIARSLQPGVGAAAANDAYFHPAGILTLPPITLDTPRMHQRTDGADGQLRLSDWIADPIIQERPTWRKPTGLTGVTFDAGVAASGDHIMVPRVAAGASWVGTQHVNDALAYPPPTRPTANTPVNRVAVSKVPHAADQPFLLRFLSPDVLHGARDLIMGFGFGGAAAGNGAGQYWADLMGTGIATIWERINGAWERVHEARYAEPGASALVSKAVTIWPARLPNNRGTLLFQSATDRITAPSGVHRAYAGVAPMIGQSLVNASSRVGIPLRPNVTGAGVARIEIPQGYRPQFQLAELRYNLTAVVTDDPFALPFFAGPSSNLVLSWRAEVPDGCDVDPILLDPETGIELPILLSNEGTKIYTPPVAPQRHVQARITLTSPDGKATPLFYGYTVAKDGRIASTGLTPWYPAPMKDLSVSGAESDPSHETSTVVIDDVTGSYTALNGRGRFRERIEVQYDPLNPALRATLFDGYVMRPDAERKGKSGRTFPSPEWRRYNLVAMGMWMRLAETRITFRMDFSDAREGPEGATAPGSPGIGGEVQPWKVTDIVRSILLWAGYDSSYVDIPDFPVRLFPAAGGDSTAWVFMPLASPADIVLKLMREYLGWYLVWDGNAGTDGMWRALAPNLPPYTNLAQFYFEQPGVGLAHHPGTYGSVNWVGSIAGPVSAFIRSGSWRSNVRPPEANCVFVTGTGELLPAQQGQKRIEQWLVNLASADFLTDGTGAVVQTAFPTLPGGAPNPDYIGHIVPIFLVDPTLQGSENDPYYAVNRVARRLYYVACHATKLASFDAPLCLVWDPRDPMQTRPRPLRYYDAILIEGTQWLVRNCNPHYVKDGHQWMHLEVEAPRSLIE